MSLATSKQLLSLLLTVSPVRVFFFVSIKHFLLLLKMKGIINYFSNHPVADAQVSKVSLENWFEDLTSSPVPSMLTLGKPWVTQ